MKDLIFCTGFKGGIGKSFMTAAVVDYLATKSDDIVIIDSDSSIPDIYKTFNDIYKTETCNLFLDEGWSRLFSICEENNDKHIVVNCAAGADKAFIQNIRHIKLASEILNRRLISFFMLNDEKDSLNMLDKYYKETTCLNNHRIAIVKNGYFGDDEIFCVYNPSQLKANIESTGGVSFYLPVLASHVRQKIKLARKSFADASNILSFGDRIFLDAWRKKVHDFLRGFLDA